MVALYLLVAKTAGKRRFTMGTPCICHFDAIGRPDDKHQLNRRLNHESPTRQNYTEKRRGKGHPAHGAIPFP